MWRRPSGRPFSLAARLTFFISLSMILAFMAFAWLMVHSVRQHFKERDEIDLRRLGTTIETALNLTEYPGAPRQQILQRAIDDYGEVAICISDATGMPIFRSPGGPDLERVLRVPGLAERLRSGDLISWTDPRPHAPPHADREGAASSWRWIMLAFGEAGDGRPAYRLLMAVPMDFHLHYLAALKRNLMYVALLFSVLIIFVVQFVVQRGHRSIRDVSDRIESITSADLNVRLDPERVPVELERLTVSFNHMLARIEDVFSRQSNFSADIAHEIRTPITNLVTQTEIALSQPRNPQDLEDVLYSNLEEFSRMSRMVSDMLFLAQADNQLLLPERRRLNLAEEVMKVFDFFEAWADERQVALRFAGEACEVVGDPLMLRRAISNLLSNAIRHTPRNMAVTVHLARRADLVCLTVENPGTPIAAEHLPRLFDRFYRVDPSRQHVGEGSGIGLAIVRSIVEAHHGSVAVASDARSTRFTLTLPRPRP